MNVKRRSIITASLVCLVLLAAAASVGAATITGTAGNDTLRGGVKADKLNGKGGNDKLYSGAGNDVLIGGVGNDLLVGGPGADKLSCGAGSDTARGDATDTIAKDCEKVTGVPTTPPPPPPPPSPPPPPPATPITPGSYKGLLDGNFVFLEITSDRMVTGFRSNYLREDCNGNVYIYGTLDWGSSRFPIAADGTFSVSGTGTGTVDDLPASFTNTVSGKVDGTTVTGAVTGTADFTSDGTHYQCSSGVKTYTATLQS
jgi:RTX calcium-binding nonapeptide repeat (4 copies)